MLAWPQDMARIGRRRPEDWVSWGKEKEPQVFPGASSKPCSLVPGGVSRDEPSCRMG